MKIFVDFHSLKWGSAIGLTIYLCCLLLLWYKRKEWKESYDLFFWLAVGALLVVYCPLTYKVLVPGFLPSFGEYERLGYVFFVIPIIAFTIIALTKEQSVRHKRILFLVACIALLVIAGRPNNMQWYVKPTNKYKVSQDAVDTSRIIRKDCGDDRVYISVQLVSDLKRKNDQYDDYLLFFGLRQYDKHSQLIRFMIPPSKYDDSDFFLDNKIQPATDYFVGPKDVKVVTQELDRLGYVQIGETKNYRVLRNQRRYDKRQAKKEETP